MNTFWLKVAGIVIIALGLIILVRGFLPSENGEAPDTETKSKPKTIYEQWEKDEQELEAEPPAQRPPTSTTPPPSQQQPTQARKPHFKKLSTVEDVEAQRQWEWVKNQRKMGRLPVMGYKQMVDTCREIIRRWPESEYAFKAKRALADLPPRYHKMYHITEEETDISSFYQ